MKTLRILTVCLFFLLVMSSIALAGEWEIKGGIAPLMNWNYRNVGCVYTINDEIIYGSSIDVATDWAFGYYGSIGYKVDDDFSIRVSGWQYDARGKRQGMVESSQEVIVSARMWDEDIPPLNDTGHPSGYSPVSFGAKEKIDVWSLQFEFVQKIRSSFGMDCSWVMGVQAKWIEVRNRDNQEMEGYVDLLDFDDLSVYTEEFHYCDYEGETDTFAVGPSIGLEMRDQMSKRFSVSGTASLAILLGSTSTNASFAEESARWLVIEDDDDMERYNMYDELRLSSMMGRENYVIPVVELETMFAFNFFGPFSIEAGPFASFMFNVPQPPKYNYHESIAMGEQVFQTYNDSISLFGCRAGIVANF